MYVKKVDQKDSACMIIFKIVTTIVCIAFFVFDIILMIDLLPYGSLVKNIYTQTKSADRFGLGFDINAKFEDLPVLAYKGKFFNYPQIKPRLYRAIDPQDSNFSMFF